jgi:plastocyanin
MKTIIAFITIAAAGMLFAANPPAGTNASPVLVKIDNFSFTPQTLTVPAGTKVTWVNKDDVPHTVTSTDKTLKSRVLDTDEQFSHTFSVPGTNSYFCSVHPHMTGKIIVR